MKNIFCLLVLSFFLNSCETIIDLDLPEHKPLLVVNSVLCSDSLMTAHISHSKGVFDSKSISAVDQATVKVYENGVFLGEMSKLSSRRSKNHKYVLNRNPKEGKIYSYIVEHEDYENVQAETQVPNSVELTVKDIDFSLGVYNDMNYRLRCSFVDPIGENYYRLRIYVPKTYTSSHYYQLESSDPSIVSSAGVASEYGLYYGNDVLFDDHLFENSEKEITIDFDDSYTSNVSFETVVEFSSISKEYYNYLISLRAQDYFDGQPDFFGSQPTQVFTNFENGLGILGAIDKDTVLIDLPSK